MLEKCVKLTCSHFVECHQRGENSAEVLALQQVTCLKWLQRQKKEMQITINVCKCICDISYQALLGRMDGWLDGQIWTNSIP